MKYAIMRDGLCIHNMIEIYVGSDDLLIKGFKVEHTWI